MAVERHYWPSSSIIVPLLTLLSTFFPSATISTRTVDTSSSHESLLRKRDPQCDAKLGNPDAQSCLDALFDLPNMNEMTHFGLDGDFNGWVVDHGLHVSVPYWKQMGNCVIGVYLNLYQPQPWEDFTTWFQIRNTVSGIIGSCIPQIGTRRGGIDSTGANGKIVVWVYKGEVDKANEGIVDPTECPLGPATDGGYDCPVVGSSPYGIVPGFGSIPIANGRPAYHQGVQGTYSYCSGSQGCSQGYNCGTDTGAKGGRLALVDASLLFGGMLSSVSGCTVS
ncbi:MAG: hypothetical protein M1835_005500 [Candelina submexicana]|nr:MAG: hypothetical protein M1835_005500 [Candelina submexicana]